MKIKPLGDRVLVKPLTSEEVTHSGIVLPESAEKEQKEEGEIVAVGNGPKIGKLKLKVGQSVVFGKYSGDEIEIDKIQYKFLKDEDILGIVEK
ncbi:MAG: co-chaperone GroES [Candidatus Lloydbacteria bacterium RIFCSPLOWO2_12_FULL_51_9]|uniref:Co-chaperonin GroES n=1 Tax=Candidatus Lloydbacteria bacterium RIFCSPLOWO2_12_FULL_51_9 TaxID=1798669 RepID=A0A1G2DQ18_9BACT|nr:MAG: co-chaperone GroES [Candidatus Lloydbacteria bacterium RIFCSPLOWO2_12_FULL_51_9]